MEAIIWGIFIIGAFILTIVVLFYFIRILPYFVALAAFAFGFFVGGFVGGIFIAVGIVGAIAWTYFMFETALFSVRNTDTEPS